MKITKLELTNFRNYENLAIELKNGLNVLVGKNAQGKTNLVEAINFCSIGKSHRTSKEKELIKFDKDNARIKVTLEKSSGQKSIEIILSRTQKKIVRINGLSILKIGELFENLNVTFFSPEDLKLVKESPQDRRKFIDIALCQMSKVYFYNLVKYDKILQQRNKLLKTSFDHNIAKNGLEVWNEQLAKVGAKLVLARHNFVNHLDKIANEKHKILTNDKENLILSYTGFKGENVDEIYRQFFASLEQSIEKDLQLGYTTVGPHRDDIKIVCNDIDIRNFGSQGQQRTTALSLKLAELEIFKEEIGEYPVLILDDVLSELDKFRCDQLLANVQKVQTILTCTQFDFQIPATKFFVENGKIAKQN